MSIRVNIQGENGILTVLKSMERKLKSGERILDKYFSNHKNKAGMNFVWAIREQLMSL